MRVAFDHQIFTIQRVGGISRYFVYLINGLKNKANAKILSGLYQNEYYQKKYNSIKFKNPPNTTNLYRYLNKASNFLDSKLFTPNILHETYYYNSIPFKGKRVTTVHDMIHELYGSDFSINDKTKILKKTSIYRANHVICVSKSTKNDLINILGIDEEKISVVHLGVDIAAFSYKIKSKIKKPFLLYVGNRNGYKNFNGFIKAFASCNKIKSEFNIIAFGGGKLSLSESQLIKKNGLLENQVIQISGGDDKLIELYQQAAAFIFPSKYEGFGLPPLEAMASNCPVISSNTSSMPEVINQAGEYFDPLNIESIRDAIKKVVFSKERTNELIKLGNENLKNFSWQKCANETLNVYNKLL